MSLDGQDFVQYLYGHESGVPIFILRFGPMPPMTLLVNNFEPYPHT